MATSVYSCKSLTINVDCYTPSVIENPELVQLVEKNRAALNKLQPKYDSGNENDNGSGGAA